MPATSPAEIVYFQKKCPKCKAGMFVVRKFSGSWWYECRECEKKEEPNGQTTK